MTDEEIAELQQECAYLKAEVQVLRTRALASLNPSLRSLLNIGRERMPRYEYYGEIAYSVAEVRLRMISWEMLSPPIREMWAVLAKRLITAWLDDADKAFHALGERNPLRDYEPES